jgi:hypothetical protein
MGRLSPEVDESIDAAPADSMAAKISATARSSCSSWAAITHPGAVTLAAALT